MPRVLLTAFEPFDGHDINTSQTVAEALANGRDDRELLLLPVVAGAAERRLIARLEAGPWPDVIISLGEAGPDKRFRVQPEPHVRLEKVAINWNDFRIPDNSGNQPLDSPIRADGPAAYFTALPVKEIARQLHEKTPLPVLVSLTAGAYVCNHLSYTMLDWLAQRPEAPPFLFIHVPRWREAEAAYPFSELAATTNAALDTALALIS